MLLVDEHSTTVSGEEHINIKRIRATSAVIVSGLTSSLSFATIELVCEKGVAVASLKTS